MVRPNFGPPRFKGRLYVDNHGSGPCEDHYSPHSRSRRDPHSSAGPPPQGWRDGRGRGRPPFTRRPPPRGDRRPPSGHHWRPQGQESFQTHPVQSEPHHGHRRASPPRSHPRPNPPSLAQHRPPHHSPVQCSPGHRGPSFHRPPSGHRSPSPRHYHSHPSDRRPGPTPPYGGSFRGSFRGYKRQHSPAREHEGSWDGLGSPHGARERQHGQAGRGGKRWNGAGAFSHHGGEPSGSLRPLHGRGSYPERSPSWKGARPTSSYHGRSQEREEPVSSKQRLSNSTLPPPQADGSKRLRRGIPNLLSVPRPLGGRPLSLRDKSRILKGRQMRGQSVLSIRAPHFWKPRPPAEGAAWGNARPLLAMRRPRDSGAANNAPPRKRQQQPPASSPSSQNAKSSRHSDDSVKEGSRRSLSAHRSPPIDRHLAADLVVVSHWQAEPRERSRDQNSKPKTERRDEDRDEDRDDSRDASSSRFQRGRRSDNKPSRPLGDSEETPRPGRSFRKPEAPQRANQYGGPRRPIPPPAANVRKPLMEGFIPRPFPQQKPVFRKSQSIMSKYRHMQALRQRGPYPPVTRQQRW